MVSDPFKPPSVLAARSPHSIFFAIFSLFGSIAVVTPFDFTPESLVLTLRGYTVFFWAIALCASAIMILVGSSFKDRITGLLIEERGQIGLGLLTLVYGGVVLSSLGTRAFYPALLAIGMGVASCWRAAQIIKFLRLLQSINAKYTHVTESNK